MVSMCFSSWPGLLPTTSVTDLTSAPSGSKVNVREARSVHTCKVQVPSASYLPSLTHLSLVYWAVCNSRLKWFLPTCCCGNERRTICELSALWILVHGIMESFTHSSVVQWLYYHYTSQYYISAAGGDDNSLLVSDMRSPLTPTTLSQTRTWRTDSLERMIRWLRRWWVGTTSCLNWSHQMIRLSPHCT